MMSGQTLRLAVFTGSLLLIALWELLSPRRPLQSGKHRRWLANLSLAAVDTVAVRLLFPLLPTAVAQIAATRGWGLFNMVPLASWLIFLLSFLLLDFIIYLQHVLFHFTPLLWRLHRVHHSDLDLDVTSGIRFHPLEIIISLLIKMAAVVLIGAPAQVVAAFEIALNACALFNHGNIKLPATCDRLLRLVLVTPDMHRIHHSVLVRETNSNFGFSVPWWDRFCGTYRPEPAAGQLAMTIGLTKYRDPRRLTLLRLLAQPFTTP
jgi:sterol desaturase/sphingolipid hydroxylase (fatty acid hydroxylase superfamily)